MGDSTVTDQAGWGKAFAALLTERAECVNRARGPDLEEFYDQGHWKRAGREPQLRADSIRHNDQPGKGPSARPTRRRLTGKTCCGTWKKHGKRGPSRSWSRRWFGETSPRMADPVRPRSICHAMKEVEPKEGSPGRFARPQLGAGRSSADKVTTPWPATSDRVEQIGQ